MSKRLIALTALLILIAAMTACQDDSSKGNLFGSVVRVETLEKIPNPVLVITSEAGNTVVVNMTVNGDELGRFEATLERGTYTVQISGDNGATFYTWPETITVQAQFITIVLFELPEGF